MDPLVDVVVLVRTAFNDYRVFEPGILCMNRGRGEGGCGGRDKEATSVGLLNLEG